MTHLSELQLVGQNNNNISMNTKLRGKVILSGLILALVLTFVNINPAQAQSRNEFRRWIKKSGSVSLIALNAAYEWGSSSVRWAKGYFNELDATTITAGSITISGVILGDLDMGGHDITGINRMYGYGYGTGTETPVTIGQFGSTSHTLDNVNDLYVEGELEVGGESFFDGIVNLFSSLVMGSATADTSTLTMIKGAQTGDPQVQMALTADDQGDFSITTDTGDITLTALDDVFLSVDGNIELALNGTELYPETSDGLILGTGSKMFSDLFLADGGILNFNNGNYTLTHSAGLLTTNGALALSGILTATGTTADGSTNIFVGNDSADATVFEVDTDGNISIAGNYNTSFPIDLGDDAGFQTLFDKDITSASAAGFEESVMMAIDHENYITLYAENDGSGNLQNEYFGILKPLVKEPSATTVMIAADAITVTKPIMRIDSGAGGAVTITSTPSIVDAADGTCVIIQGDDDTNTITLQDEAQLGNSGLQLAGTADMTLGAGDMLEVCYDAGDDNWYEISRSNN